MKDSLNFLLEVNKLKETTRTGWIIWRIQNPETIAEHIFRVCFLAFLLGKKKGLRLKTSIQDALSHDLCEVYAGDATPLFYYQKLDVKKKKDRKILMKGIRLRGKDKERRSRIKFEREKKSLLKLIKPLRKNLKNEIFLRWLDQGKGFSKEGKFVRQLDWIENLIQSLEYLGPEGSGSGWWEIAEEKVYDPLLLDFLATIQKKFYKKAPRGFKRQKDLECILDFFLKIGKLKQMPRTLWVSLGVKKPETVAGHIFSVSLMAWIFGRERKELNMEKLLKMALCHEICAVYTGDLITPFGRTLLKIEKEKRKVLEKWPRLLKREKEKIFLKDYAKEREALKKLTSKLEVSLGREMVQLFDEYKTVSTPESRFLNQINVLAVLLQALQHREKDKKLPIDWMWEWVFEKCEEPSILEFLEELKKKFC